MKPEALNELEQFARSGELGGATADLILLAVGELRARALKPLLVGRTESPGEVRVFEYPHVELRDGSFYIVGSRLPVHTLYRWHKRRGEPIEALATKTNGLDLSQVLGALSFAYDHEELMTKELAETWDRLGETGEP